MQIEQVSMFIANLTWTNLGFLVYPACRAVNDTYMKTSVTVQVSALLHS